MSDRALPRGPFLRATAPIALGHAGSPTVSAKNGVSPEPPLLVLLNSCDSAAQLGGLVTIVPFAIGMTDSVQDGDAITYAARFYANVANARRVVRRGTPHRLGPVRGD